MLATAYSRARSATLGLQMKSSIGIIIVASLIGLDATEAKPRETKSPRSKVTLTVPEKWQEHDLDVVWVHSPNPRPKKDRIILLLDRTGIQSTIISQGFPLKVSINRPSDEVPFTLVVLEKQIAGPTTELVDAIMISPGSATFLDRKQFEQLKATHASIPGIIDELNKELNKAAKDEPAQQVEDADAE